MFWISDFFRSPDPVACEAFKKAVEQYTKNLSDDDKKAFHSFNSGSDVMAEICNLNNETDKIRVTNAHSERVQKILNCIKQFMGTLSIFIQHSPEFSSLAMGGVNCVLLVRYCYDIVSDLVELSGLICVCVCSLPWDTSSFLPNLQKWWNALSTI